MKDMRIEFEANLARLDVDDWFATFEELTEDLGYFEPLGDDHVVGFIDAGPKLFVTFESAETIRRSNPDAEPRGFHYVRHEGWSHLAVISHAESWFRDETVYRYFDRLIDDGFFEDFDKVLFHGIGSCGYAAAAFSVAAPGCTVLAIRPQATLAASIAGFDHRHAKARRDDFTTRYGYAPDMIDAADQAFIAFDPTIAMDAVHAALFTRKNMTPLRCYCMGNKPEIALDSLGAQDEIIKAAMNTTLNKSTFAAAIRNRCSDRNYRHGLFGQALRRDHPVLAANVAAYVLRDAPDKFFEKKLQELAAKGHHPTRPLETHAAEQPFLGKH
jgi:hypothetical protein